MKTFSDRSGFFQLCLLAAAGWALLPLALMPESHHEIVGPFRDGWLLLSNGVHNAFLPVRARLFFWELPEVGERLLSILVFVGGLISLRYVARDGESLLVTAPLGVLLGSFSYQLWFVESRVLTSVFVWFPALVSSGLWFARDIDSSRGLLKFGAVGLLAVLAGYSSGALAFTLLVITLVVCIGSERVARPSLLLGVFFILGFCFLVTTPTPPWPDYPAGARILASSPPLAIVRNLVGFDPPLPSLDRVAFRTASCVPFIGIFLALWLGFLFERRRGDVRSLASVGLFFVSLAVLDIILPASLVDISPLAAASRIIPFAALYPLSQILLIAGVLIFGASTSPRSTLLVAFILAALVGVQQLQPAHLPLGVSAPTPSLPLDAFYGEERLLRRKEALRAEEYPLNSSLAQLFSSRNPESLPFVLDGVRETRWSVPSDALQMKDFLIIQLQTPVTLHGIILDSADFWTDFPDGIRVRGSADCLSTSGETVIEESSRWRVLVDETPWRGPVQFTSDGHPYWEQNGRGELIFDEAQTVRCLRVEPTIQKAVYDWSVSEIGLLAVRGSSDSFNS